MPTIYDPRKPSGSTGGKAVIAKRSSRRRKKSSSSRVEEAKKKGDDDSVLDFFGDSMNVSGNNVQQQQQPATKSVGIKDKNNNDMDRPSTKIATVPNKTKTVSTQTQRSIDLQSMEPQRAVAVDTRFLDSNNSTTTTSSGASYSDLVADNIQQLLQSANDRGLDPCILAWTKLQQPVSGVKETCRSKAQVIEVHSSLVDSSNNCPDFPGVPIRPAQSKDGNDATFHIPKLLSANASWKLFGDFGTLFIG